jgi:hypothetical protein
MPEATARTHEGVQLTQRWSRLWSRFGMVVLAVFVLRAIYHLYLPLHGPFDVAVKAYPEQFPDATYDEIGLCMTCATRRIRQGPKTTHRFTLTVLEAGRDARLVEADVVEDKGVVSVTFRERK